MNSQDKDSSSLRSQSTAPVNDTFTHTSIQRLQKARAKLLRDQALVRREQVFQDITILLQEVQLFLRRGPDTSGLRNQLNTTKRQFELSRDGIFTQPGSSQSSRNLDVSAGIVDELLSRLSVHKKIVDEQLKQLQTFRSRIDSLTIDSSLYMVITDSQVINPAADRSAIVLDELRQIEIQLDKAIQRMDAFEHEMDRLLFSLRHNQADMQFLKQQVSADLLNREFGNIWSPIQKSRPLPQIIHNSLSKVFILLRFYFQHTFGHFLIVLFSFFLIAWLIRQLKNQSGPLLTGAGNLEGQLVLKNPLCAAGVIAISLGQFIFPHPPFFLSFLWWLLAAGCLTRLFESFISPYWMKFWLTTLAFFIASGLVNSLLQASRQERWLMLAFSVAGIFYFGSKLFSKRLTELREKNLRYFIAFVAVMQLCSFVLNLFGRYNLAKAFFISGFSGIILAVLFLWTVRLLNEILGLATEIFQKPDRKLFYFEFNRLGQRMPKGFTILLITGWLILISRHYYLFTYISQPLVEFITQKRTLGEYSFSFASLLVFFVILGVSFLVSRVISFFGNESADPNLTQNSPERKVTSSWLLISRIVVMSLGFFLALAATGIPLDRLTIILGALSVGIGLGLQEFVNNLASGLTIAFEKPVAMGDIVELDGKPGIVESVGFRSTIIKLIEGPSLIIPNGDLLNGHLVNWTLGKNRRRIKISVPVAVTSDLTQVKSLLHEILRQESDLDNNPEPQIYAREFVSGAVIIDMILWVNQLTNAPAIQDKIVSRILTVFRENGIEIPVPKQDIIIHRSLP